MTLKDIFDIIKDREWDNFGLEKSTTKFVIGRAEGDLLKYDKDYCFITGSDQSYFVQNRAPAIFTLADLLANQSWCLAVWGDSEPLTTNDDAPWGSAQKCLHCGVDPSYQPSKEIMEKTGCQHVHYPEACTVCNRKSESYVDHSVETFKILQKLGQEKALEYILKTIRK